MTSQDRRLPVFLAVVGAALAWSGVRPHDRLTWLLEVAPILIAAPVLLWSRRSFPLTPLVYALLFVHAFILIGGAHSTYARQPLGEWARQAFSLERNPYDRLGHLAQGFVPAMLVRELLRRRAGLAGKTLFVLTTCVCLAFSAFYELIEWASAISLGQAADDFLGTQGDPWDTQWDMFLALAGAVAAQLSLARVHDRQMAALPPRA